LRADIRVARSPASGLWGKGVGLGRDQDLDETREHYMKEAKAVVNDVVDTAKRAARAFSDTFKKK